MKEKLIIIISLIFSVTYGQEICNNGIDDDGDNFVDFFDPDCECNIVNQDNYYYKCGVNPCQYTPPGGVGVVLKWSTSVNTDNGRTVPLVADLDSDGVTEVISRGTNNISIFDGSTGTLIETFNPGSMDVDMASCAIADIDNDGRAEIFTCAGGRVKCFQHNGTNYAQLWATPVSGVQNPSVNIADMNQDGVPEVIAANVVLNSQTGIIYAAGTGSIGRHSYAGAWSVVADVLPDGACANCQGLEIIAGNHVYSVNIDVATPANSSINVEINMTGQTDGRTSIADIDRDGDLDAVIVNLDAVYVWDLQTPTLLAPRLTGPYRGQANIGDFNNDGIIDFGIVGQNTYTVLSYNNIALSQLWQIGTNDGSAITGSSLFDFDANGSQELVYRDETNLRVLNGATGVNIVSLPCGSSTRNEYPVVADVDDDGESEIVVTHSNSIRVYESDGTSKWAPSRNVWNQNNYFVVNVNDDLSIPIQQQNHGIVEDSLKMNTFLSQYSNPEFVLPNIHLDSFLTEQCNGDSLELSFEVCNTEALIEAGYPISLYIGNPFLNNLSPYTTQYTSSNLVNTMCQTFTLNVAQTDITDTIFIIANDSGIQGTSLSVSSFPYNGPQECNYLDNILQFYYEINFSASPTHVSCFDSATGRIDVSSLQSLSYSIDSGTNISSNTFFDQLVDSTYTIRAYNSINCYSDTTITITEPSQLSVSELSNKPERCFQLCDGEITLTGTGGTRPFNFSLNSTPNPDSVYTNLCPSIPYIGGIVDANGCIDTIHLTLDSAAIMIINSSVTDTCVDNQLTINASAIGGTISTGGDYTYYWGSLSSITGNSQTFISSIDTIIQVFAVDDSACHSDTATIQMHINPFVSLTKTNLLCFEDNTGSIAIQNSNCEYQLDAAGFQSATNTYSNLAAGTYSVAIRNQFGCIGDTSITITQPNQLTAQDSTIDITCNGADNGKIFILATEGTAPYEYSNDGGNSFTSNAIIDNLSQGNYNLTVRDANNCIVTLSTIVNEPDSLFIISSPSMCIDDSTTINSITTNGLAPLSYQWTVSTNSIILSTNTSTKQLPATDTRYIVTVTDSNGCQDTSSTLLKVIPKPSFTVDKIEDCNPATFLFTNTSITQSSQSCLWTFGDGFTEDNCNSEVSHRYITPGKYSIRLLIIETNGCINDTIVTDMVHSKPIPIASFNYLPENPSVINNEVNITNTSINSNLNTWIIDGDTIANSVDLTYLFDSLRSDTYEVCLFVDTNGCYDEYCEEIFVAPNVNLFLPNAFSPNGDGMNETFGPTFTGLLDVKMYEFAIMNEWGEKIFSTSDYNDWWDGSNSGTNDVFVWYIKYQTSDQAEVTFEQGHVFLLR